MIYERIVGIRIMRSSQSDTHQQIRRCCRRHNHPYPYFLPTRIIGLVCWLSFVINFVSVVLVSHLLDLFCNSFLFFTTNMEYS